MFILYAGTFLVPWDPTDQYGPVEPVLRPGDTQRSEVLSSGEVSQRDQVSFEIHSV